MGVFGVILLFRLQNYKKFQKLQNFRTFFHQFAYSNKKQYLCAVKRVEYMAPIDWMAGNLSGRQVIKYAGGAGYDVPTGETIAADDYQPRLIVKYRRKDGHRYYQVRTRTSVNMSATYKENISVMGGACAIFSALVRNKQANIYKACVAACPGNITLRKFIVPKCKAALLYKAATIRIAEGVEIVNPWVSTAEPNVVVTAAVLDKFANILSNS